MRISDWSSDVCSSDLTEIARAEEAAQLVEMVGAIDRRVQAEAGEADVANGRHRLRRVVEQAGGERERRRPAAAHREDIDAILEQEAAVEELRLERQPVARPQRARGAVAEVAVLVVADLRQRRRQHVGRLPVGPRGQRSEEHTSELQSLMRISYAVFCLKKKKQ